MAFEFVQSRFPELSIWLQPLEHLFQWFTAHAIEPALCNRASLDEAGRFENSQMLRHRRLADLELANQVADRSLISPE